MANEVKHGRRLTPEEKLEHRKGERKSSEKQNLQPMHSCVSDRRCDLLHRAAYRGFRNGGIEPCGTGTCGVHFDRFDFRRRIAHGNRGLR